MIVAAFFVAAPVGASDYNEESCQQVAGTLNIHWEGLAGIEPCTGIEFTDGDFADTLDGMVVLNGTTVSNHDCIAEYAYEFTLSADGSTLTGSDTISQVPMTLTRGPGEACFVGHWVDSEFDYLAHLSATPWIDPVCGDVNDNGSVTAADALLVLKTAVGQDVPADCAVCGDGAISNDESCDLGNLDGRTCESLGFEGGDLGCTAGCSFDSSGCYATRFDASGTTILDHKMGLEWEKKNSADGGFIVCPGDPSCDNPRDADNNYAWCAPNLQDCANPGDPMDGPVVTDFLMRLNGGMGPATCYAGHCDWRLPTIDELADLPWPAVPAFLPDGAGFYWSASNNPDNLPASAFGIFTSSGTIVTGGDKALGGYVRAVRGRT